MVYRVKNGGGRDLGLVRTFPSRGLARLVENNIPHAETALKYVGNLKRSGRAIFDHLVTRLKKPQTSPSHSQQETHAQKRAAILAKYTSPGQIQRLLSSGSTNTTIWQNAISEVILPAAAEYAKDCKPKTTNQLHPDYTSSADPLAGFHQTPETITANLTRLGLDYFGSIVELRDMPKPLVMAMGYVAERINWYNEHLKAYQDLTQRLEDKKKEVGESSTGKIKKTYKEILSAFDEFFNLHKDHARMGRDLDPLKAVAGYQRALEAIDLEWDEFLKQRVPYENALSNVERLERFVRNCAQYFELEFQDWQQVFEVNQESAILMGATRLEHYRHMAKIGQPVSQVVAAQAVVAQQAFTEDSLRDLITEQLNQIFIIDEANFQAVHLQDQYLQLRESYLRWQTRTDLANPVLSLLSSANHFLIYGPTSIFAISHFVFGFDDFFGIEIKLLDVLGMATPFLLLQSRGEQGLQWTLKARTALSKLKPALSPAALWFPYRTLAEAGVRKQILEDLLLGSLPENLDPVQLLQTAKKSLKKMEKELAEMNEQAAMRQAASLPDQVKQSVSLLLLERGLLLTVFQAMEVATAML